MSGISSISDGCELDWFNILANGSEAQSMLTECLGIEDGIKRSIIRASASLHSQITQFNLLKKFMN